MTGKEELLRSLGRGRGAILWVTRTHSSTVITKRTLAEAGIRAYQLSARNHGLSASRFSVRNINPGLIAEEDKYLAGRFILESDDAVAVTRRIIQCLKNGNTVLFTNTIFAGRSFLSVPFAGHHRLLLATTPIHLALQLGVPLHVVTTVERESFQHYMTHVTPELTDGLTSAEDQKQAIARVALRVRDCLLGDLKAAPDQVWIWDSLYHNESIYDLGVEEAGL